MTQTLADMKNKTKNEEKTVVDMTKDYLQIAYNSSEVTKAQQDTADRPEQLSDKNKLPEKLFLMNKPEGADSNRIAIFGASYGGYAALVGMTMTPDVFACGIDLFGPSNLVTTAKNVPAY
uniref:Peptidase S9 prolyl oligopeptidase catalytic domain-containing protein n=1 Tax=Ditylenchus dipsaci TaxID=166011 RepID=A0A915E175_9BILA